MLFPWFARRIEELRNEGGFTLIELLVVITLLFHKQLHGSQPQPN